MATRQQRNLFALNRLNATDIRHERMLVSLQCESLQVLVSPEPFP